MLTPITDIFCQVDDFCKHLGETKNTFLLPSIKRKRNRSIQMHISEIMTILILFQLSDYRTFKHFYINCILSELRPYFPKALSYSRFVGLMEIALLPLVIFFEGIKGKETGTYYVDSTSLEVCHIKREKRHKVFKGLASKGMTSVGWFFGFKLHIIINTFGEIMSFQLTSGNVSDVKSVEFLAKKLKGWLFGDKGYIGKDLAEKLREGAVDLFTKVRKNMKDRILTPAQKFYLSKRGIVETVIDQLKNICHIEHSRHRKPSNALVNIVAGIVAYFLKLRKPSLKNFIDQYITPATIQN